MMSAWQLLGLRAGRGGAMTDRLLGFGARGRGLRLPASETGERWYGSLRVEAPFFVVVPAVVVFFPVYHHNASQRAESAF